MFFVSVTGDDEFLADSIKIENGKLYATVIGGTRAYKLSTVVEVAPVELEIRSPVERIEKVAAAMKDLFDLQGPSANPIS